MSPGPARLKKLVAPSSIKVDEPLSYKHSKPKIGSKFYLPFLIAAQTWWGIFKFSFVQFSLTYNDLESSATATPFGAVSLKVYLNTKHNPRL